MSVGFLVNFVNNTPFGLTFSATGVASETDWDTEATRPDKTIKGTVGPFSSSGTFHEERHDYRSTAPFTVEAKFDGHNPIQFVLDGCNATQLANDGEVKVIGGSDDFSVFQVTSPGDTWNTMTIFLTPFVSPRKWMGRLIEKNGSLTLTDITIPGTHDSGTYGGTHEMGTQCQTMDIKTQLQSGIRFLDLRVKKYDDYNDLGIFHQLYSQYLWVRQQILPDIAQFLAENPTECVIICVNHAVDGEDSFDSMLHDILVKGLPPNKLYDHNDTQTFPLKLSSLQGCVVLMRRDQERTFGINATKWPDNPAHNDFDNGIENGDPATLNFSLQDAYKTGLGDISSKWANVVAHLDRAKTDNTSSWFINFTSASSSTAPAKPWFPWGYATAEGTGTAQWGINSLLSRYLVSEMGQGRLGTIVMDYPEYPGNNLLNHLLIARNERLLD